MNRNTFIDQAIRAPRLPKMQSVDDYLSNGGTITVLPARVKRETVMDEYGDKRRNR